MSLTKTINKIDNQLIKDFSNSVINSYSQIFFSTHTPFALLILLVTFFDFYTGLFGLISVLTSALTGFTLGFDRSVLAKGLLGFNSLLVGLGLGVFYTPSLYLFIIVILAALFTFFISVTLLGIIGKYGLPFLSIPFIIGLWSFMLATKNFDNLGVNERGIFKLNELYTLGGLSLVNFYEQFNQLQIPQAFRAYFISLSAILFQYNILTGIILSIGLLLFSRIAFSLSLIGFFLAYGFYHLIGAEITVYDYSFFGFNYILSSIALGGFFIIPSRKAYLWMVMLIPFVAILTISLNTLFINFKLPIYSLPFNMVVLLFLYALKFRVNYSYSLSEVYFQHNSPEKNLYIFLNNKERFRYKHFTPIKLPFFGQWIVSQGEDGEYTHQGAYKHAWDFNILNSEGKQFKNQGDFVEDYYCYNKPVIAPENGVIEDVIDGIEDNIIGQSNLIDNWGNTIIIKHENGIYSKLCHLKKGSIKIKKGDEVHFGQILANCGNSGRSPYPHLHFQLQLYPYIGSVTLDYPLSNYIKHAGDTFQLKSHTKPLIDEVVSNIESNNLLFNALNFIPGQIVTFQVEDKSITKEISWEIKVNEFNESYFFCPDTESKAYFENDKNLFYFTYFEGKKDAHLFYFFQSLFKLQTGFYQNLEIIEQFPLYLTFPKSILWFLDFISPFVILAKSQYKMTYKNIDDIIDPKDITLISTKINLLFNKELNSSISKINIGPDGIESIEILENRRKIVFKK